MRALNSIALVSLFATGCVQDQEALLISHAVAPTVAAGGSDCTITAGGTPLIRGVLDVSFNTGYMAGLSVRNNLQPLMNSGIDVSEMAIRDAEVRLAMPQDPAVIDAVRAMDPALVEYKYDLPTTSILGSEDMGVAVEIPRATISAISEQMGLEFGEERTLNVSVVVNALRSSNTGIANSGVVSSREFTLPVRLCAGCLRECVSTTAADTDGAELCDGSACISDPTFIEGGACGNAQTTVVNPTCCSGQEPAGGLCG
jgi:hypothetical protein